MDVRKEENMSYKDGLNVFVNKGFLSVEDICESEHYNWMGRRTINRELMRYVDSGYLIEKIKDGKFYYAIGPNFSDGEESEDTYEDAIVSFLDDLDDCLNKLAEGLGIALNFHNALAHFLSIA